MTPDPARFFINRLMVTGPAKEARLDFVDRVNVVWGSSNSGKSLIVKILDFMCGAGSPLPDIEEMQGYDRGWLELRLPQNGVVTLSRALKGGAFNLFEGPVDPKSPPTPGRTLSADHRAKSGSVSSFLLDELGISGKRIVKNKNGEKSAFTFRHFVPYVFTEETDMLGEWSPIRIDPRNGDTFDKNVLKFIATGLDDSAVIQKRSAKSQREANSGKIELVEEMITAAKLELEAGFPGNPDLTVQDERISRTIAHEQTLVAGLQKRLDEMRKERRAVMDALSNAEERAAEISITLERFDTLRRIYDSDIERLAALEEGGAALLAGSKRACPLCGAEPEHQRHIHGVDEIGRSQQAVRAEMAKIKAERADLAGTVASLYAERDGVVGSAGKLKERAKAIDLEIEFAKPHETQSRGRYERLLAVREEIRKGIALLETIKELKCRKEKLGKFRATSPKGDPLAVGVGGVIGHEIAMFSQEVLRAWEFPGLQAVSFEEKSHDISINGKSRSSNGKGVRALMNAAFKIGLLNYCRAKGLPHPGVIVLDSPLLSYRDPHTEHGDLSADEMEVKQSGLKGRFYEYLIKEAESTQFIIIENDVPPFDLGASNRVLCFVGKTGKGGRKGFL